jgi:catecholate siderophore receptor
MSCLSLREAQRAIQSKAGLVSVAALFYLSHAMDAEAEPAAPDEQPRAQEAPAPPAPVPAPPPQTAPDPAPAPSAETAPSAPPPPAAEQQGEMPIPPVSVQAARPRPPAAAPAQAAPTRPLAPPPPPPATPQPATGNPTIPVLGATPYQVDNSSITRLPVPILNTPQTINVIPQQIIQEQSISTVEDALRYIPGITFSAGEGGQQGDGPIIRGFVARGDIFRDGIRDPGWYTRDAFSIDRVEVYKGPSAFAFGRGSTGGAINVVTKLPTGAQYLEWTSTLSTGWGLRETIDASGKKDNVSGRIQMLWQDVDTPTRDNIWTKRWGIAPSMTYDFKQGTKATLSYIHQGEESVPDNGLTYLPQPGYSPLTGKLINPGFYGNGNPTPVLPVPRNLTYVVPGGPLRDIVEDTTHILTGKVEHQIDKDIKIVNQTRFVENDRFALPTSLRSVGNAANQPFATGTTAGLPSAGYPFDQMTVGRERRERQTNNDYFVNQTDLAGKWHTGSIEHQIAAGVEFSREGREQGRHDICDPLNAVCRTNIVNPSPNLQPVGGAIINYFPITTSANNTAAYMSDQLKVNQYFELLGSLRFDHFGTIYDDPNQALVPNRHLERTDNMWSYRFGAVGHPTKDSSVYVVYGNSYNPSAELGTLTNASVAALAPEQTKTIEIGAKADVLKGKLTLSGAIFRIEKMNLRITDPTNNTVSVLDGVARVDGLEVGAVGKVTDKWSVFTGYSYLDSAILNTRDMSIINRRLPQTSAHNFTLWSTYDITSKWTVGGGAIYQSMGWANQQNTAYVPGYWKFDAMVSYKVDAKSTLQLNIYNFTNTFYYAQYFGANAVPGPGRWAALTYRTRW